LSKRKDENDKNTEAYHFMKLCPQCHFIYPDSDKMCDFDRTTLVEATESEIATLTNTPERLKISDLAATHSENFQNRKSRKALPIAAASGLCLGIVIVGMYLTVQRQMTTDPLAQIEPVAVEPIQVATPAPSPSPLQVEPSPEPAATVPAESEPITSQITKAHSRTKAGPISTSAADNSSRTQVIVLTTGARVQADQVWQTKDGVWYRRNGIVTLLKKNHVKAIVSK
jgi:hypothetical protein